MARLVARIERAGGDPLEALLEPVAHNGFDTMREPSFTFSEEVRPYDAEALVATIEGEGEGSAAAWRRALGSPRSRNR
tara:strand:+ start:476 stop:709 length:234 start_codon:yes stop_codon:yes gene_type:complete